MTDVVEAHWQEYRDKHEQTGQETQEPLEAAEAPGRLVFLGGSGADGLFLSAAIDRVVRVSVSARRDNSLRFFKADTGERRRSSLTNFHYKREDRWANCIKAAIYLFIERGYHAGGMNFTVTGNVPKSAALGSSRALELASALALRRFFHAGLSDRDLLMSLAEARNRFYERNVRNLVADYLTAMNARKDYFVLVDEENFAIERIRSPFSKFRLLVTDSRVPPDTAETERELTGRRADVEKGRALLREKHGGKDLRDFVRTDLQETLGRLPEDLRRRCTHVIKEVGRVGEAVNQLREPDIAGFARTASHSHESLRDLYEVTCPEIDWLVKRSQEISPLAVSRMTGRGFGGCVYAFLPKDLVDEYVRRLDEYERIFGFHPSVYEIKLGANAKMLTKK